MWFLNPFAGVPSLIGLPFFLFLVWVMRKDWKQNYSKKASRREQMEMDRRFEESLKRLEKENEENRRFLEDLERSNVEARAKIAALEAKNKH